MVSKGRYRWAGRVHRTRLRTDDRVSAESDCFLSRARFCSCNTSGFSVAGISLIPAALAESMVTWLFCLTLALAALELTVPVSWAICLDIGGDFSGSVSGVMNTLGNLGGAVSSISIGYLVTHLTWIWVFLAASFMCIAAALLSTRIDPSQVLTEE